MIAQPPVSPITTYSSATIGYTNKLNAQSQDADITVAVGIKQGNNSIGLYIDPSLYNAGPIKAADFQAGIEAQIHKLHIFLEPKDAYTNFRPTFGASYNFDGLVLEANQYARDSYDYRYFAADYSLGWGFTAIVGSQNAYDHKYQVVYGGKFSYNITKSISVYVKDRQYGSNENKIQSGIGFAF